jgi:hypothetical protein
VSEHIKQCGDRTKERIDWLLELEKRPYTLNTHYYSDYKDKFLSFYRGCREKADNPQFMADLQKYRPHVPNQISEANSFQNGMAAILSGLPKVGITGTRPADIARLFPSDPMEPALNIMAGVRAYFQGLYSSIDPVSLNAKCSLLVAYKRFADIIPSAIDHELVCGLQRGMQDALYKGLKITGPNAFGIARDFVREPPNISARREELQKKLDRLNTARTELLQVVV